MIRCKVTPHFTDEGVRIVLEWVEIVDEKIAAVVATEEFTLNANREGCSYVTRGGFDAGKLMPGTFWIDEKGSRHFVMEAEPGQVGMIGNTI